MNLDKLTQSCEKFQIIFEEIPSVDDFLNKEDSQEDKKEEQKNKKNNIPKLNGVVSIKLNDNKSYFDLYFEQGKRYKFKTQKKEDKHKLISLLSEQNILFLISNKNSNIGYLSCYKTNITIPYSLSFEFEFDSDREDLNSKIKKEALNKNWCKHLGGFFYCYYNKNTEYILSDNLVLRLELNKDKSYVVKEIYNDDSKKISYLSKEKDNWIFFKTTFKLVPKANITPTTLHQIIENYSNVDYLKNWNIYTNIEYRQQLQKQKEYGILECSIDSNSSDGNYYAFNIQNVETKQKPIVFPIGTSVFISPEKIGLDDLDKQLNIKQTDGKRKNIEAVVERSSKKRLTVKIVNKRGYSQFLPRGSLYYIFLCLNGEFAQINRRNLAIKAIESKKSQMPDLGEILDSQTTYHANPVEPKIKSISKKVKQKVFPKHDPSANQLEAILMALNTPDIALIQGPPGTGKTTVITAIVEALNELFPPRENSQGEILVTALQHDAVINLGSRLFVNSLPTYKFGDKTQRSYDVNVKSAEELCKELSDKLHAKYKNIDNRLGILEDAYNTYCSNTSDKTAYNFLCTVAKVDNGRDPSLSNRIGQLLTVFEKKVTVNSEMAEIEKQSLLQYVFALRRSLEQYQIDGYKNALLVIYKLCEFLKDEDIRFLASPFLPRDPNSFQEAFEDARKQKNKIINMLNTELQELKQNLKALESELNYQDVTQTVEEEEEEEEEVEVINEHSTDNTQDLFRQVNKALYDIDKNFIRFIEEQEKVEDLDLPKVSSDDLNDTDDSLDDTNDTDDSLHDISPHYQRYLSFDIKEFNSLTESEKEEYLKYLTFLNTTLESYSVEPSLISSHLKGVEFNTKGLRLGYSSNSTSKSKQNDKDSLSDYSFSSLIRTQSEQEELKNNIALLKEKIKQKERLINLLNGTKLSSQSQINEQDYFDNVNEVYGRLVESLNSRQKFQDNAPLNLDLCDIQNDLEKLLNNDFSNPEDAIIAEYMRNLDNNSSAVIQDLKKYNVVYSATVQQSMSEDILNMKQTTKNDIPSYNTVIVDEAARANPLDLLIPMIQAKNKIILVGDHKQLPHIIDELIAQECEKLEMEDDDDNDLSGQDNNSEQKLTSEFYKKSLFEYFVQRLKEISKVDNIPRVIMLNKQYRMHPLLGQFISDNFYDSELYSPLDGSYFEHNLKFLDHHCLNWLETPNILGYESKVGTSRKRDCEIEKVCMLIQEWLMQEDPQTQKMTFGVIAFYQAQIQGIIDKLIDMNILLKDNLELDPRYNPYNLQHRLKVGTVDSFQGMEFDAVILSMVRSKKLDKSKYKNPKTRQRKIISIFGHLVSKNRLCVSLSRQRRALVIVGDSNMLKNDLAKEGVSALVNYYNLAYQCKLV